MGSTLSLRNFPSVAYWNSSSVGLIVEALSHPFKEDHQALCFLFVHFCPHRQCDILSVVPAVPRNACMRNYWHGCLVTVASCFPLERCPEFLNKTKVQGINVCFCWWSDFVIWLKGIKNLLLHGHALRSLDAYLDIIENESYMLGSFISMSCCKCL